jgi:exodeoxyribonuclease III
MRIATWNVNSIKAHFDNVMAWTKAEKPDVLCFQEIKCEDPNFPAAAFEELGYQCSVHGQKTYNGVALLSLSPMENVIRGLAGDDTDEQARFIQATIMGGSAPVTVACIYLPNGNPAPGPKYDYKLAWMERLYAHATQALKLEEAYVITGDFNIIPAAADVKKPDDWKDDAQFRPQSRAAFEKLKALGFTEAFRASQPFAEKVYSFWDYQAGAWQKNNGIRIDHALLSPQAADRLVSIKIDKSTRGEEKPSDHVPVITELM